MTKEGAVATTVWQDAAVRKPLMAVSACEDKGNMTIFDKHGSCILSGNSPEIGQIRALLKKASKKVAVERTGGTYSFRMWRMPHQSKPANHEGFQGRVKR